MANIEDAAAKMVEDLKLKTGRSLDDWTAIAANSGAQKHGAMVKVLKGEHGLTHGYANLIAHAALGSDAASLAETVDLVASQYSGEKAGLRPVYEAVIKAARAAGPVEVAPKKAYVSLRRTKQFAIVQPTTKVRVDLGLNLKGVAPSARLEPAGSFNAMVTHRVRLAQAADVDEDVRAWLRAAFDRA